jgi:hypothetical protein
VEILLWLVPPLVVTLVAMLWVGWIGRAGRGEVDRDEALRRIGAALENEYVVPPGAPRRRREPGTGVAVRRTSGSTPETAPAITSAITAETPSEQDDAEDDVPEEERRAS